MEKVKVGKIINTHGIKGELKIDATTDFPDIRFQVGNELFINNQSFQIKTHRVHKGYDLVSFEGLQNINDVEKYKGLFVYAYKDESLLDEEEYYIEDWKGCKVYNNGEYLGEVVDIYENFYQDLIHVDYHGKKLLIPSVDQFIIKKDIENKRIDVSLIEGFLDEN